MTILSFLSELKDIAITMAAIAGVVIAYKGLTTWRKELEWRSTHETSKSVLRSVYGVRKAIHGVRNNWISPNEYPLAINITDAEKFTHIFKQRWEAVDKALEDLEAAKVQGQALWGKNFENCFNPLYEVIQELNDSINHYLELLKKPISDSTQLEISECKRIIFHVPVLDAKHDSYASKLYKAIKHIDESVRDFLKSKSNW